MVTFYKNRQLQSGSTGVVVPVGDNSNYPSNPVAGEIRYNTDLSLLEFYNGATFQAITSGTVSYTVDTFTGDSITTSFTMTQSEPSATQIIVFVGSIYQDPVLSYNVSNFTITFTSAPPAGTLVNIIHTTI